MSDLAGGLFNRRMMNNNGVTADIVIVSAHFIAFVACATRDTRGEPCIHCFKTSIDNNTGPNPSTGSRPTTPLSLLGTA